jgi:NADH-quinone oxidoreductase subunit J
VNELFKWSTLGPMMVVIFGAIGTYLLLPHRHGSAKSRSVHIAGGALTLLAVLLLATFWREPGPFLTGLFFYTFSFTAIGGGILMVTSRNPVYSALWFAAVVLATSGLFLLSGAQFLAAGTVIVYAGAIIVTFLFVIMLAQSEGYALYDRAARSPVAATLTSFLLFWCLLYALLSARNIPTSPGVPVNPLHYRPEPLAELADRRSLRSDQEVPSVINRAVRPTARLPRPASEKGATPPHVAALGGTLYTDHLITIEIAGAILFVALVGAAAIATPKPPVRPGDSPSNINGR